MNCKPALYLCFAIGLSQIATGCSDADTPSKSIENSEVLSAETEVLYETGQAESSSPPMEVTSVSRSADSHVHGGATLSVVSEKSSVFIEFETPLYNLIGFEYTPQTDEEKARVLEIEKRLAQPETLVSFNNAAKCTFVALNQDIVLFSEDAGDRSHHDVQVKHDDEHDNHHDDEEYGEHNGDDHHHNDDDEHAEGEHGDDQDKAHADITLSYAAECESADKLETIEILVFEDFPNMTNVELVYLGPSQQIGADLTPSNPTAELTR